MYGVRLRGILGKRRGGGTSSEEHYKSGESGIMLENVVVDRIGVPNKW